MERKGRNLIASFVVLGVVLSSCGDDDSDKKAPFVEDFEDVPSLIYEGWAIKDNSVPMGTVWKQGKATSYVSAKSGGEDSFITITLVPFELSPQAQSSWLITPILTMKNGDQFIFHTINNGGTEYQSHDRLQVRRNTKSTDVNVGDTPEEVGDFTTLLLDMNALEYDNFYPNIWVKTVITITDLPEPKQGRLAFRHFVTEPTENTNGIAIDSVAYVPR